MKNSDKIRFVYDTDLRRPGCPLLQAAMGGTTGRQYSQIFFEPDKWLLAPTPGMKLLEATYEQWQMVASLKPLKA